MTTIRVLRLAQGLTQQELSVKASVGPAMISRIENDHYIGKPTFKRLCIALGVSPDNVKRPLKNK